MKLPGLQMEKPGGNRPGPLFQSVAGKEVQPMIRFVTSLLKAVSTFVDAITMTIRFRNKDR